MGGAVRTGHLPYAAKPETSNLQQLLIYGVSPGMASRNFRATSGAHRTGRDRARYTGTERWLRSLFSATISTENTHPRRNGGGLQDRLTMGILVGVKGCRRMGLQENWG